MSWNIKNYAKVIDEGNGARKGISFDITWDGTIPRDFAEVVLDLDVSSFGAKHGSNPLFAVVNSNTRELTLKQVGTEPPKATVVVWVTGDTIPEADETMALTLRSATWYETDPATGALVNTGTESVNLVSSTLIRDDDTPPAGAGVIPAPGTPVTGGGGATGGAGVGDTGGAGGGGGGTPDAPGGGEETPGEEDGPDIAHVDPPKDDETPPEDPLTEHTDPPKDGPDSAEDDPPEGDGPDGPDEPVDPPQNDAEEAPGDGSSPTPETDDSDPFFPPEAEIDLEIPPPTRPEGIDWDDLGGPELDGDLVIDAFNEKMKALGLTTEGGTGGPAGPTGPTGGQDTPGGEDTPGTAHVDPPKDVETPAEDPLTEHTDPPRDGSDSAEGDPPESDGPDGPDGPADPPQDGSGETTGGGRFGSRPPTPESDNSDLIFPPEAEIDIEIPPPTRPEGIDWDDLGGPELDGDLVIDAFNEKMKALGLTTEGGTGGPAGPTAPTGGDGEPAEAPETGGAGDTGAQPKPGAPIPDDKVEPGPAERLIEELREKGFVTGDDVALASASAPSATPAGVDVFLFRDAPRITPEETAEPTDIYPAAALLSVDPVTDAIPGAGTAPADDFDSFVSDDTSLSQSVSATSLESSLYDLG